MAAQRLALRRIAGAESLSEHPLRGRSISGGRRTLAAIPPYLIRYRGTGETVESETNPPRAAAQQPASNAAQLSLNYVSHRWGSAQRLGGCCNG